MSSASPRDLIGYGAAPPDPDWPGGARVAVNFALNFEEGSEASFGDGDGRTETALTEVAQPRVPDGHRDLAAESMYEYGTRVGFWRLHRLFLERGLPVTVFGCALALERHPPAAAAIRAAGWDVCCHGWRWVEHYKLPLEEEREHIARAVASIERTIGRRPVGWYCRYGPSEATRRLLIEEGGFLYDSDAYNDDLPYWVFEGGHPHLVVPYSLASNDVKLVAGGLATGEALFAYLKDGLDFLRREARARASIMNIGMHLRILGHPVRAAGLERFLDHVAGLDDVWVCRREDLARRWIEQFGRPAGQPS